ncbi:hypothetical protein SAMN05216326_1584 [Nitrosomonas marina]|uniref:Uncharacterized protein n=1 Tax=Nitrosomonas marina TaxID=917 RepID=A0A1I0G8U2_9PROT|nr:hypothetical protein SAMN05216326_1584 [Nitrosomonas marina]
MALKYINLINKSVDVCFTDEVISLYFIDYFLSVSQWHALSGRVFLVPGGYSRIVIVARESHFETDFLII